ncbi:MAG: DUF1232 domain-containing protein [Anaerolineales bacterium]
MTAEDERAAGAPDSLPGRLRRSADRLARQTTALLLAYRHPRTPWYAKAWAALVLAYAFSPLDLIPDFIPLLGSLDDLLLVPLGIWLAVRMIPPEVMAEARTQAEQAEGPGQVLGRWGVGLVILVWLLAMALVVRLAWGWLKN